MELDEQKILTDTRKAFKEIKYESQPFTKKDEIQRFVDFLLRHETELLTFNCHHEGRLINLSDQSGRSGYTKFGDSFEVPTFYHGFIKNYIPPQLIDSLYHFSEGLRDSMIVGFTIGNKKYWNNIDKNMESIALDLKCRKSTTNPNYYVFQQITLNNAPIAVDTLHSIYDNGLCKDTVFVNSLRYRIIVRPYSRF